MTLLAVDTSAKSCSVAIIQNGSVVTEITHKSNSTHSKHLMNLIDKVLDITGITLLEFTGFAFCKGPGSFTGLRIGLSVIKGLAVSQSLPIAGVSSLDALASNIPQTELTIIPIIDARKGEVYTAQYQYNTTGVLSRISDEKAASPEQIVEQIDSRTVFVGSGVDTYKESILKSLGNKAIFPGSFFNQVKASTIGSIGYTNLIGSTPDAPCAITPNYLRQSDAELNYNK